jgi:ribosomal protein L22
MSAEEEDVAGDAPDDRSKIDQQAAEEPTAAKKRAAKKSAAAKGSVAESKTDAKAKADVEQAPDAEAKPASEAKTAAKKPAAAKESPAKAENAPAKEPVASEQKKARPASAKPPRRRVVRAHARYVRTSARKARMVCSHLRGKTVPEARAILEFTPREVARDWSKLLESAVANAENNHELLGDDLVVREAYADEGPTIKRFRPRAMGRATPIHKRTSHLTITLTPGS